MTGRRDFWADLVTAICAGVALPSVLFMVSAIVTTITRAFA